MPRWLIARHSIAGRWLTLPNGARMPLYEAKVPACSRDNNVVFSELEDRIKDGTFTHDKAYLWAYKIHAGFSYLDTQLRHDLSNRASGPMSVLGLDGESLSTFYSTHLQFFRAFVHIWKMANGRFRPSPPGSVFVLDSLTPNTYQLTHGPLGIVGVNLGAKFLAVVLFDGGFAKKAQFQRFWTEEYLAGEVGLTPTLGAADTLTRRGFYQRFWLARLAYSCDRHRVGCEIRFRTSQAIVRRLGPIFPPLPPDDPLFLRYLQMFGVYHLLDADGKTVVSTNPDLARPKKKK